MTQTKTTGLAGIVAALVLHFTGTSTHWAQLIIGIAGAIFYLVDHVAGGGVVSSVRADLEHALEALLRFLNASPSASAPVVPPAPPVNVPTVGQASPSPSAFTVPQA